MPKTKKLSLAKKTATKKRTKILFKKLEDKSKVVKNMFEDLNNTNDFKGFIVKEVPAKYYKDLIPKRKNEVYKIIELFLESNKAPSLDKVHTDTIIGIISVAKLLEIKELFRHSILFLVKKFNNSKLRKKEQEEISKLIDLAYPDDVLVKEAFKKKGCYDPTIFNLFDDFIDYSIKMDVNHAVLQKLFDIGFNVKTDYTTQNDVKLHRAEELKTVIEKGSLKLFKILIESGKRNTNVDFDNCHMLNWAVFYDRLDIVKYLIEKEKHNVNQYCNNSFAFSPKPESATPIYNAVLKRNSSMVRYLISKKADVNLDSNGLDEETPAYLAVKINNLQILKLIVKAGANLDTQTPDGSLAFDIAVESGNKEMVDYLIKHGARIKVNSEEIRPDYDVDY
tara:strand:+ start:869 stop:2047 length:1179 start_codon:yes stop_codon:yes gene_type:complete